MCACVRACVRDPLLPAGGALVLQLGKLTKSKRKSPTNHQTVSLSAALSSAARVCASSVPVHIVESSFLQQRSANKQLFGHSLFLLKNGSGLERESIRDSPGNPGRSTPMFPVTVANHHTILAMSLVLHRLTFNSRMR